jgi:hypothetical protein
MRFVSELDGERRKLLALLRAREQSLDVSELPDPDEALAAARRRRDDLRRIGRPWFAFSRWTLVAGFIVGVAIGMPITCVGEAIAKHPMWGFVLCPHLCSDCRGPGVTVTWHEGVDDDSGSDHSRDFCDNDRIDVHASSFWSEGVDEDKHRDIEIPSWMEAAMTLGSCTAIFAIVFPPIAATRRRRALARESRALDARIAQLEASIAPVTRGFYR